MKFSKNFDTWYSKCLERDNEGNIKQLTNYILDRYFR